MMKCLTVKHGLLDDGGFIAKRFATRVIAVDTPCLAANEGQPLGMVSRGE